MQQATASEKAIFLPSSSTDFYRVFLQSLYEYRDRYPPCGRVYEYGVPAYKYGLPLHGLTVICITCQCHQYDTNTALSLMYPLYKNLFIHSFYVLMSAFQGRI